MIAYKVSIVFATSAVWNFFFKSGKSATDAYRKTLDPSPDSAHIEVVDDYGQSAAIRRHDIHGILLSDILANTEGEIELAVHQMQSQAKAQRVISNDPVLKAHAMLHGIPPIDIGRRQ